MYPEDENGAGESENGIDVLADWFGDRTKAVMSWCQSNPVAVGAASVLCAAAGAALFAFSKKR